MGFLGFGKKKSKIDASKTLERLPNTPSNSETPPPLPDSSLSNQPAKDKDLSDPSQDVPVPVSIPVETDLPIMGASSSSLDDAIVSDEKKETPFDDVSTPAVESLPDSPDDSSFDALPDFSEEDFSAPPPPSAVFEEKKEPPKESKPVVSNPKPFVDKTSLFAPAKNSNSFDSSSFRGKSYADSQGVFVARTSYISLLNSLKESSKDVSSLSTRQKHLIDFDNSMKKLFDEEAVSFEKLHKDILAIVPFISKK